MSAIYSDFGICILITTFGIVENDYISDIEKQGEMWARDKVNFIRTCSPLHA